MKRNRYFILLCLGLGTLASCSDWTEVESISQDSFLTNNTPDSYYKDLRDWKAQKDHQITFGWYGNWTGSDLEHSMRSLPDSVDVISVWGSWKNLTDRQKADLQYVQQVKGTKALLCFIVANVGDQVTPQAVRDSFAQKGFANETAAVNAYWGWDDNKPESINQAIDKYAKAICDTIHKYNYDGFDIDYEPNYGSPVNMAGHRDRMLLFCQSMRTYLGDGKMLVVDGEPQSMPAEAGKLLDYFIVQAYNSYGDADLDNRLQATINNYQGVLSAREVARKYVVTEDFEKYASVGGTDYYQDREGNEYNSLEGMARWIPVIDGQKVMKGGFGSYHMEYDYPVNISDDTYKSHPWLSKNDMSYPWLRSGMRALRAIEANPDVKR